MFLRVLGGGGISAFQHSFCPEIGAKAIDLLKLKGENGEKKNLRANQKIRRMSLRILSGGGGLSLVGRDRPICQGQSPG